MKKYKQLHETISDKNSNNSQTKEKGLKGILNKFKTNPNRKVVYRLTTVTGYKSLESYLSKMAAKGYMVIKISNAYVTFEKCEPIELDFNVGLFYKSIFSSARNIDEMDYKKLCIDSGWTFVFANDMFQIFYKTKDQEITPILTDEEEEYKLIKKIFIKTDFAYIFIIVLYVGLIGLNAFGFGYRSLYTNTQLFMNIWPILLLITFSIRFFHPFIWLITNRYRLNKGLGLKYVSEKQRSRSEFLLIFILIVHLLLFMLSNVYGGSRFSSTLSSVTSFVSVILLTVVTFYFAKYIKRIDTKPIVRMIVFSVSLLVVGYVLIIGTIVIVFMGGNDQVEEQIIMEASKYALTLEQFGPDKEINHTSVTEEFSIVVNRTKYVESYFDDKNSDLNEFIRTDTIECRAEFVAKYIYKDMYEHELERYKYRDDYKDIAIEDYIYELEESELGAECVYVVADGDEYKLIIKDGKRIIVLESRYDLLDEENQGIIKATLEL